MAIAQAAPAVRHETEDPDRVADRTDLASAERRGVIMAERRGVIMAERRGVIMAGRRGAITAGRRGAITAGRRGAIMEAARGAVMRANMRAAPQASARAVPGEGPGVAPGEARARAPTRVPAEVAAEVNVISAALLMANPERIGHVKMTPEALTSTGKDWASALKGPDAAAPRRPGARCGFMVITPSPRRWPIRAAACGVWF